MSPPSLGSSSRPKAAGEGAGSVRARSDVQGPSPRRDQRARSQRPTDLIRRALSRTPRALPQSRSCSQRARTHRTLSLAARLRPPARSARLVQRFARSPRGGGHGSRSRVMPRCPSSADRRRCSNRSCSRSGAGASRQAGRRALWIDCSRDLVAPGGRRIIGGGGGGRALVVSPRRGIEDTSRRYKPMQTGDFA